MRVTYKETVVRWKTISIPEVTEDLVGEDLEETSRNQVFDAIAQSGWDGEDVLENSFDSRV